MVSVTDFSRGRGLLNGFNAALFVPRLLEKSVANTIRIETIGSRSGKGAGDSPCNTVLLSHGWE